MSYDYRLGMFSEHASMSFSVSYFFSRMLGRKTASRKISIFFRASSVLGNLLITQHLLNEVLLICGGGKVVAWLTRLNSTNVDVCFFFRNACLTKIR